MVETILVSNDENNDCISQRINEITVYQRQYIRTILSKLAEVNKDNAKSIYGYIITEQDTFNIKESTKEGKIRINVESEFRNRNISIKVSKRL